MKKKSFISVGECMVELQSATDGLYRLGFAGDTLNTAWYLRALTHSENVSVDYLTAIGTDQLSLNMKTFLDSHKIGTKLIKQIPDRTVGLYLITLAGAERSFTYWRDRSAAKLLAEDEQALRSALSVADCIYFSGITLAILSSEHRANFLSVLSDMKSAGAMVVFDSNSRRRLWPSDSAMKEGMVEGYKVSTLALPTFDDEQLAFGDKLPIDCLNRIASYGVAEIVVKDGPRTCLAMVDNKIITIAPDMVTGVVDTTGAGDSFNAGYIAARLSNRSPTEAIAIAHQVAGRVICKRGALLDMASFNDLVLK